MTHTQIHRAKISPTSDKVITEIRNIIGTLPLRQRDTESDCPLSNQGLGEKLNGLKTNLTTKDYRSAYDRIESADESPFTLGHCFVNKQSHIIKNTQEGTL